MRYVICVRVASVIRLLLRGRRPLVLKTIIRVHHLRLWLLISVIWLRCGCLLVRYAAPLSTPCFIVRPIRIYSTTFTILPSYSFPAPLFPNQLYSSSRIFSDNFNKFLRSNLNLNAFNFLLCRGRRERRLFLWQEIVIEVVVVELLSLNGVLRVVVWDSSSEVVV